ncbi:MAG TPA: hypothetical protein VII40_05065 [Xanthobacteraceae bacterium]
MPRHRLSMLAVLLALTAATSSRARDPSYVVLDPDSFQSFVANWMPETEPKCAAMRSRADWDKVMHPAPVMGGSKPFAPGPDVWAHDGVLLVARVIPAGDTANVFKLQGVRRADERIDVDYAFTPPARSSSTVKWWLGVRVAKPLTATVRFVENGRVVCMASAE